MSLIITQAGLNAVIDAEGKGLELVISHIALGTGGYVPSVNQTALQAEFMRKPFSNSHKDGAKLFLSVDFALNEAFEAREIGYFTDEGILFAVDSRNGEVVTYKTAGTLLNESFEIHIKDNMIETVTVSADNAHNHSIAQITDIGAQVPSKATYLGTINLRTLTSLEHCGFYFQFDAVNATPERNYPEAEAGSLEVKALSDGIGVIHEYTLATGKKYTCTFHGNVWSAWDNVISAENLPSLDDLGAAPANHNHDPRIVELITSQSQITLYVDSDKADDSGDGLTQATAFKTIKAAIDSTPANAILDIRLTAGQTYEISENISIYSRKISVFGNAANYPIVLQKQLATAENNYECAQFINISGGSISFNGVAIHTAIFDTAKTTYEDYRVSFFPSVSQNNSPVCLGDLRFDSCQIEINNSPLSHIHQAGGIGYLNYYLRGGIISFGTNTPILQNKEILIGRSGSDSKLQSLPFTLFSFASQPTALPAGKKWIDLVSANTYFINSNVIQKVSEVNVNSRTILNPLGANTSGSNASFFTFKLPTTINAMLNKLRFVFSMDTGNGGVSEWTILEVDAYKSNVRWSNAEARRYGGSRDITVRLCKSADEFYIVLSRDTGWSRTSISLDKIYVNSQSPINFAEGWTATINNDDPPAGEVNVTLVAANALVISHDMNKIKQDGSAHLEALAKRVAALEAAIL